MNGITIPGLKIKVPQSAMLFSVIALAAGAYVGSKYIFGKGTGLQGSSPAAFAVRAYAADTNLPFMRHRVVNLLMRNATNRQQVINNMDRVLAVIASEEYRLKALADERASGAITPQEFRGKLFEIVKMIATQLGISLAAVTPRPNPIPKRMVDTIEAYETGRIPEDEKLGWLVGQGYGLGRDSINKQRNQERRDFRKRTHGIGNINIM